SSPAARPWSVSPDRPRRCPRAWRGLRAGCRRPGPAAGRTRAVRAVRDLQAADVLLLDALVDTALVEPPPGALMRRGSKRGGGSSAPQDFICRLMRRYARQGLRVVRVKGGDALLFGRAGEEIAFLRAAG